MFYETIYRKVAIESTLGQNLPTPVQIADGEIPPSVLFRCKEVSSNSVCSNTVIQKQHSSDTTHTVILHTKMSFFLSKTFNNRYAE